MKRLTGKKAIVIGGSRGTGKAIVKSLLEEDAEVIALARNPDSLKELLAEYPSVKTMLADASAPNTAKTVLDLSPDLVILAAGAPPPLVPIQDLDWEAFSVNWHSDVKAAFQIAHDAILFPAKKGALFIFISSGAGIFGSPITGGYAGAKRMQMFLANYAQDSSNRLNLDLRFVTLVPWRLMEDTGVGNTGIPTYSSFLGLEKDAFLKNMTFRQTKEDLAAAVLRLALEPPALSDGNNFGVSSKGITKEKDIQQELVAK